MARTKGSKNRQRHTPNPMIELHKYNRPDTIEAFCNVISPKNADYTMKILQAIKDKSLIVGCTGDQIGVSYHKIRTILARLQDLGILTRDYTFSEGFQNKLTDLSIFYGNFANKPSRLHNGILEANRILKDHGVIAKIPTE